jgi:16S rRNA (guanine527-N7)-methyltransferase
MDDGRLTLLAELIAGSPHNLVSGAERQRLGTVHIPEAAALVPLLGIAPSTRWLDLGTGGGLPGLVLATLVPDARFVLLDATAKKVEEVRRFAAALALDNVEPRAGRAEELARADGFRAGFDGVVARAVAPLATLLELARGFLGDGGVLAAVKGPAWRAELAEASAAMALLRWELDRVEEVTSAERPTTLVRMRAVGPPPKGFPRRTGVPKQDPIRARSQG